MTCKQLDILRHALGWPNNYRNHYVCGPGHHSYEDCEAMVKAGLMSRRELDWVPDPIFVVTEAGKAAAEAGEVE